MKLLIILLLLLPGASFAAKISCAAMTSKQEQFSDTWKIQDSIFKSLIHRQSYHYSKLLADPVLYGSQLKQLEALGFKVSKSSVEAPSLADLLTNFDIAMEKSIIKWNQENPNDLIKSTDVIRPAIALKNLEKKGPKYIFLRHDYGIEISGYSSDIKLVGGEALYTAVSQKMFPLAFGGNLFHDITGHLTSYLEHPNYAKEYSLLAKKISDRIELNDRQTPWIDIWEFNPSFFSRVYHFNESLVLGSQKGIIKNSKLFPYEKLSLDFNNLKDFDYNFDEMAEHLRATLSLSELKALSHQLQIMHGELFIFIGGAARDPVNSNHIPEIFNLAHALKRELLKISYTESTRLTKEDDLHNLSIIVAKYQWLAIRLSTIDVKTWREMISAEQPSLFMHELFSTDPNNAFNIFEGSDFINPEVSNYFTKKWNQLR